MAIRAFPGRRAPGDESPEVSYRLFCFPYAGAGAAVFRQWPDHLPSHVELCVPCLPGRDARIDEPPAFAMAPLVASLAQEMLAWLAVPYALFGHSMGAFIAFDLALELSRLGRCPAHLFVSAQRGPSLLYAERPTFTLPDDEFVVAILARYASIPKRVLEDKDLRRVLLRTLRADFTLAEDYHYPAVGPFECPITVFGGADDKRIAREQLEKWSAETTSRFECHMLPGGHFFMNSFREEMLSLIRDNIERQRR